jgi:hypothetical protein
MLKTGGDILVLLQCSFRWSVEYFDHILGEIGADEAWPFLPMAYPGADLASWAELQHFLGDW